jgi:hypothetical protein
MPTVLVCHEIDDKEHWLSSKRREELLAPLGIKHRTFVDPQNEHRAAVLFEVPDMATFQSVMSAPSTAEAMAGDGVRADTVVVLVEHGASA